MGALLAKAGEVASSIWFKIGLVAAGLLAVLTILLGARNAGKAVARLEQKRRDDAAIKETNVNDATWDALPPDAQRRRLRQQRDELRRLLRPDSR